MRAPFRPAWWARTGLLQTTVAAWGRATPLPPLRLERWSTPDDDFVRVHKSADRPGQPNVLLLHGLEGSVASNYVGECARHVLAAGWNFTTLEFRSCGGELNRQARSYHSGETGDLAGVIGRLLAEHPDRPLFLIGFSLGGNVLLKWLGEVGDQAPAAVRGAVAICPPFDLEVAARQCDRRYGGSIARHFLRTLIPKALAKAERFPGLLDVGAVRRCRSFATFDDLVTAPLHGFTSATHYWRSQSCARFLPAIRRPTLLLAAADDPLVPATVFPHTAVADSRFLTPCLQRHGGHVGFVDGGTPWRPRRWAEAVAVQFLRSVPLQ
ncbi:MAG: alpha/beta fold hydrolase [Planctomycetes bacterium]|nr:alpha/beta fold hydrolase [Planctomycetota bacterium]